MSELTPATAMDWLRNPSNHRLESYATCECGAQFDPSSASGNPPHEQEDRDVLLHEVSCENPDCDRLYDTILVEENGRIYATEDHPHYNY